MKAYWHYRCDHGHSWVLFREEDAKESPEDIVCPYGHEAVTLTKRRLLDFVQVSLRPAAQIVDRVTGQTGHEYEFYVVVTDLHRSMERSSTRTFRWAEAKAIVDQFRNVKPEKAWQLLEDLNRQRASQRE
jgi:hypothetical protein